jgi:tRNA (cytidine/uridine-2'-O-)-methyltransferase
MRLAAYQPDIALNVGALIRLSACFGAPLDVIEPCGFPFSLKAVRRAAMDYADIADLTRWDSWDAWRRGAPPGRIVLLTTAAETAVWDFAFRPDDRLLLGRESAGVPPEIHAAADARIAIPMPGGGRSLNIAMAAGIALAEAMRQMRAAPEMVG